MSTGFLPETASRPKFFIYLLYSLPTLNRCAHSREKDGKIGSEESSFLPVRIFPRTERKRERERREKHVPENRRGRLDWTRLRCCFHHLPEPLVVLGKSWGLLWGCRVVGLMVRSIRLAAIVSLCQWIRSVPLLPFLAHMSRSRYYCSAKIHESCANDVRDDRTI